VERVQLINSVFLTSSYLVFLREPGVSIVVKNAVFSNTNLSLCTIEGEMEPTNETDIDNVTWDVGLDADAWVPIDGELAQIPAPKLTVTVPFTESKTFSLLAPHKSASVFVLATSGISAGVLATIFGILSLIMFLFLLYLRRGSAATYKLIGRFHLGLEFDGAAVAVAYEDDKPDVEYTYSVSYEYYYDSEGEGKPGENVRETE
jgi:hypothetical protein